MMGQSLGMMSGSSLDAIDIVWCGFEQHKVTLLGQHSYSFPEKLKQQLWQLTQPETNEISLMLSAERALTQVYVSAVHALMDKYQLSPSQIAAIGCHGQTLRHGEIDGERVTLQIGDISWLAAHTGIACVGDFRRKDIALGGQGAPLMPAFHEVFLGRSPQDRAVVNIGGIANVTFLPSSQKTGSVMIQARQWPNG